MRKDIHRGLSHTAPHVTTAMIKMLTSSGQPGAGRPAMRGANGALHASVYSCQHVCSCWAPGTDRARCGGIASVQNKCQLCALTGGAGLGPAQRRAHRGTHGKVAGRCADHGRPGGLRGNPESHHGPLNRQRPRRRAVRAPGRSDQSGSGPRPPLAGAGAVKAKVAPRAPQVPRGDRASTPAAAAL